MKKSLIITFGACLLAFGIFSAFSDSMSPEQKEQQQKIQDLLTEKLDAFRIEKEQECMDRAVAVAVTRADSIMTAQSAAKTPVRKKPTYTTKGTTPKTTTPPPTKSDGEQARDKMRKTTTDAASKTTEAPATKEELIETANKAKDKMRKKKGDN